MKTLTLITLVTLLLSSCTSDDGKERTHFSLFTSELPLSHPDYKEFTDIKYFSPFLYNDTKDALRDIKDRDLYKTDQVILYRSETEGGSGSGSLKDISDSDEDIITAELRRQESGKFRLFLMSGDKEVGASSEEAEMVVESDTKADVDFSEAAFMEICSGEYAENCQFEITGLTEEKAAIKGIVTVSE